MSHSRHLAIAFLGSLAGLAVYIAPAEHRWRWKVAVMVTAALVGAFL